MTEKEFKDLALEYYVQWTKVDFLENKRKSFDCLIPEYVAGLLRTYKELEEYVNQDDHSRYIFIRPDGTGYNNNSSSKKKFVYREFDDSFLFTGVPEPGEYFYDKKTILVDENSKRRIEITNENVHEFKEGIDAYIQHYGNETKEKRDEVENSPDENLDLFSKLVNKYFEVMSINDFNKIVNHQQCTKQYLWKSRKADAIRFMEHFGIPNEMMNSNFSFNGGRKLRSGNRKGISPRYLAGINKYLKQLPKK